MMINDLIIWFLTQGKMLYVLFVPAAAYAFVLGMISIFKGLSKWT